MGDAARGGAPRTSLRAASAEGVGVAEESPQLEIVVLEGEGCTRIVLRGELDVAAAASLSEQLAAVNRTGVSEIRIDLSGLTYLDPAGVSPLVAERQRASASGATLRLESPSDFVREVLTVTGLAEYLGVAPEGAEET